MLAHFLLYWPNLRPTRFNVSCLLLRCFDVGQCNIIMAHNLTTILHTNCTQTINYFIIIDSVLHGELIPLHLPSFRAFKTPLKEYG